MENVVIVGVAVVTIVVGVTRRFSELRGVGIFVGSFACVLVVFESC